MACDKYELWLEQFGLEYLHRLADDGLNDEQIAERCGLSMKVYRKWKKKYPEFAEAVSFGRGDADFRVVKALYDKATGFSVGIKKNFKLKRVEFDPETGKKVREYEELVVGVDESFVPADLNAEKYWLENRQPERWGRCPTEKIENDSSEGSGVLILSEADSIGDDTSDVAENFDTTE